jgi:hypothetical protein
MSVKPLGFLEKDKNGYFVKVQIPTQRAIIGLLKIGVVPMYDPDLDIFYLNVYLNNSTKIRVNGMRLSSLSENNSLKFSNNHVSIRELAIKRYSKNTFKKQQIDKQCYATRLLLKIGSHT